MKAWALLLLLAPVGAADHLTDDSYRCDGGWCGDGEPYILDCAAPGCRGRTGGFTTIRNPQFGDGAWLDADDRVIGVAVHGDARAYPLKIISGQQGWELIDDTVGGLPVVVTYCPLCGSPIAFSRIVDGRELDFLNTGAIWRFDLVMWDPQTRSQWSQVSGEAIDGPLHGAELELAPHRYTSWSEWQDLHPDSVAMERPTTPNGQALCSCDSFTLASGGLVTGTTIDGQTYGFDHSDVKGPTVLPTSGGGIVATQVDGTVYLFAAAGRTFDAGAAGGMLGSDGVRYDQRTGKGDGAALEPLPTRTTLWTRWDSFFPDTVFFEPTSPATEEPTPAPLGGLLLGLTWAVVRGRAR